MTKTNEVQHTATPWRVGNFGFAIYADSADREPIAITSRDEVGMHLTGDECRANAARIVECVNAHDALTARVAELEAALREIAQNYDPGTGAHNVASAALAKAR